MTSATEIWIHALQHEHLDDGRARRLTSAEVHLRALKCRPGWLV